MIRVEPTSTLGELVAERPGRATVFDRLRLDYCCGGAQTLADACQRRGLDLGIVQVELENSDAAGVSAPGPETRDWREASIGELCAHIVAVHHEGLREAFPRIEALLATVARVHGATHRELQGLEEAFRQLRAELEPHLATEEDALFPACQAFELGGRPVDEALLSQHEREHATTGDALKALRVLAGDAGTGSALCNAHRALLDELAAFERDLHRHVHEENNVLIPRVRELTTAIQRPAQPNDHPLPRCCQAWIAEQSRSWALTRS